MPFQEDNTENRGRKKGSPNKNTKGIKDNLQLLIESNILTLDADLRALTPKDRVNAIINLSKFILPTLKAIDSEVEIKSGDTTFLDAFTENELEILLKNYK
tara:strand:+ start:71 stop:373 length:303 start_codon:yes stop_codon:yes gene_type:complete